MAYDLKGRHVFITGASRGIGRACAEAFHAAGAKVTAAARSIDELSATADRLGRDRVLPVRLDVTDPASRQAAVAEAQAAFGPIDVLVNNAGWAAFGAVERVPPGSVERMVRLNVLAPMHLTAEVLPEMLARRAGQVIFISSVVGHQPIAGMSAYSATKAALLNFADGLRMEVARSGIDVITVSPSSTRTDFFTAAERTGIRAVRLERTQYTPERVARAVVRASRRRRQRVILSVEGNVICRIRRLSPWLADAIMERFARWSMPREE